ncbi:secretin N-terminal domain-containing protein [Rubricoccus marinus]|uniref:Secretin/TonB short N-terminal domain-containing protein n=1 Tax=Rubricoccus marinus TaxID=716817 RepID=A0A259TU33_9BACT|nr:secretin N-terminal domain-containing protein [Rubricoccus marinus]OZC01275.1 hypothetical protein BSZ36_17665 [Rubricoccus marinus]
MTPISLAARHRLQPSPDEQRALTATFLAYAEAWAWIAEQGRASGVSSLAGLHTLGYRVARDRFGLGANLAVRAVGRAAHEIRAAAPDAPPLPSLDLDVRTFRFLPDADAVSLASVHGRLRAIPIGPSVPTHQPLVSAATLRAEPDGHYDLYVRTPVLQGTGQLVRTLLVGLLFLLLALPASAQIDRSALPPALLAPLDEVNVRDADLRDVLRAIGAQQGINLVVDDRIERRVTVQLVGLPVIDALASLADQYGLVLDQSGPLLRIRPALGPGEGRALDVRSADGLLSLDLDDADLGAAMRAVARATGLNVLVPPELSGTVSGRLQDAPAESGLRALLATNGYELRIRDDIYLVARATPGGPDPADPYGPPAPGVALWVQVQNGLVSVDAQSAPVARVLDEIAAQAGLSVVAYGTLDGTLTARWSRIPLAQAVGYALRGTSLGYRLDGPVLVVGDRTRGGINGVELIRLRHVRSTDAIGRLPESLRQRAVMQDQREQNGILVTGSADAVDEVRQVLSAIDIPVPQVLIEALVVDFSTSDLSQLGLSFGVDGDPTRSGERTGAFGSPPLGGGFDVTLGADAARDVVDLLGLGSIGRLPADFYIQLQALVQEGKATVRSRPQIATLSGHTASITVGTSQYYLLKSIVPTTGTGLGVETERFEKVDANVSLVITPWVGASGDVTAEIKPEFSSPVGAFEAGVPPTINSRTVDTTVRLRDGETIIIGGLIQESQAATYNKVPLLGSIPLLGRLFRNRRETAQRSELVIFITPHVFYGDETDGERTDRLNQRLGLPPLPAAPRYLAPALAPPPQEDRP